MGIPRLPRQLHVQDDWLGLREEQVLYHNVLAVFPVVLGRVGRLRELALIEGKLFGEGPLHDAFAANG
jgi:hypothetical protein